MDWFEGLTGFRETSYRETRARLEVVGGRLYSKVNGASYGIGFLELPSLSELRKQTAKSDDASGRTTLVVECGDVREIHRKMTSQGSVFQVASQFNLLEMQAPDITPEHGVTRYRFDHTQGPACAIAAGAATIYRNYFADVRGHSGQTSERQLDTLADLGARLSGETGLEQSELWTMRNGYALATESGLDAITRAVATADRQNIDEICGLLRVGVHRDVEVTDAPAADRPTVTQVFCSAMPVAYTSIPEYRWRALAQIVLDGAYEATLHVAVLNARRGLSRRVYLTQLGAGSFGNPEAWVLSAISKSLTRFRQSGLDVRIVCRHSPSDALSALAQDWRKL
jgi:hypothetical protein